MKVKRKNKILVIGLDGATFDLIYPLVRQGKLPNFKKFINNGTSGPLLTTIPPVTASAWTSFATGKNPGKHGLFDFLKRERGSYKVYPVDSQSKGADDLWDILSKVGEKSIVINVPVTYPPDKINGLMITGMLTPRKAKDYTHPLELKNEIRNKVGDYIIFPREVFSQGREKKFLDNLKETLRKRTKTTLYLMKKYEWDFFMVVFNATDVAQHGFWGYTEPRHPYYKFPEAKKHRQAIQDVYETIDKAIGQILRRVDRNTYVILMSDHGAGPLYEFLNINNWLVKEGYLRFKTNPLTQIKYGFFKLGMTPNSVYRLLLRIGLGGLKVTLDKYRAGQQLQKKMFLSFEDVNWKKTKAYGLGYIGQIFINKRGREPQGIVRSGNEYQKVRQEIIDRLKRLKNPRTGKAAISEIYKKEKIYKGPFLKEAPDIVFYPRDLECIVLGDFEFTSNKLFGPSYAISAHHRMEGIFIVNGPGVEKGKEMRRVKIIDLAPTILALLGIPVPADMDGRVIKVAPSVKKIRKDGLQEKIGKSKQIIERAIKRFGRNNIGVAWTTGKDSMVLLHLIRQMFKGEIPFRLMFGDTTVHFQEVYKFIDKMVREWDLDLVIAKPEASYEEARGDRKRCCHLLKTLPAQKMIKERGWKAIFVGIRWDEQEARANERYFSKRKDHERIHPILHWTEKDIWEYIKKYKLPTNPLYRKGYRSLGCQPCTQPTPKEGRERDGRDQDKEEIMRRLRDLGYW